jgi:hypothetical protein
MIWDFLKTKKFNILFSFLLGLGLMALLRPVCKGDECILLKAPPAHEVKDSTYQIGMKCYKFETYTVDCPQKGAIEAFTVERLTW